MGRFFFTLLLLIQSAIAAAASECDPPPVTGPETGLGQNERYFDKQINAAEQLRQTAANAGAEWLETESLLAVAREQAGSGNWSTALELVQKACMQAELALQQAEYESEAWKSRVVD